VEDFGVGLCTALDASTLQCVAWPAFFGICSRLAMAQGRTRIIGAQQYSIVLRINAYASHSEPSEIQMSQQYRGEIETSG
jgi:hypothetical protein